MFSNLGKYENSPFDDFRQIQREIDHLFGASPWPSSIRSVARGTYPPINIGTTPDQVDVYLFAAGVDPKTLDITIQQNLLTIAGERKLITEESANYYRKERYDGTFRRVVTLPDDVDPDKVDASYRDGILRVTIQRHESAKPRQIEVK
jgi:HSP20 family protein